MDNNIVQVSGVDFNDIRSEFHVDEDGKTSASRRATGRLSGRSDRAIRKTINSLNNPLRTSPLSPPLQPFAGQSFEGANLLPDVLVGAIIAHYAFKGVEKAQKSLLAFSSIGVRAWIQQELNWKPQNTEELQLLAQYLQEQRRLAAAQEAIEEKLIQRIDLLEVEFAKLKYSKSVTAQRMISTSTGKELEVLEILRHFIDLEPPTPFRYKDISPYLEVVGLTSRENMRLVTTYLKSRRWTKKKKTIRELDGKTLRSLSWYKEPIHRDVKTIDADTICQWFASKTL